MTLSMKLLTFLWAKKHTAKGWEGWCVQQGGGRKKGRERGGRALTHGWLWINRQLWRAMMIWAKNIACSNSCREWVGWGAGEGGQGGMGSVFTNPGLGPPSVLVRHPGRRVLLALTFS